MSPDPSQARPTPGITHARIFRGRPAHAGRKRAEDTTEERKPTLVAEAVVTMKQLLEAGVHFGHQTRRWNPKMRRFIFGERNGIYIIDLQQTLERIDTAYRFVRRTVADGGTVLFVGHEEAGPGADPAPGGAQRHALRQLPLARRHAHELPDRPRPRREAARARAAGRLRARPSR